MAGYETVLAPDILKLEYNNLEKEYELEEILLAEAGEKLLLPDIETQNIIILSILLVLGLTTNLLAFPVILFRRTKFGNGQFAVLVLCLTMADLLTITCGLLGGLILEVSHMTWEGNASGCSAYYFLTTWLLGLANYLVSALLGMIHVKRSTGWVSRFQECKTLLLSIILATLLPALTEFLVRSTVSVGEDLNVCIITAEPIPYGFYVAFKIIMCHLLPVIIVVITILKPRTKVAKRFSALFLGEGSACECGPSGEELKLPHECPSIGTRPDLVTSHREAGKPTVVTVVRPNSSKTRTISIREDPHRRKYKCLLTYVFLFCTILYILVNISYQIHSGVSGPSDDLSTTQNSGEVATSDNLEEVDIMAELGSGGNNQGTESTTVSTGLVTGLYAATYLKQIINPVLLVYVEFFLQ